MKGLQLQLINRVSLPRKFKILGYGVIGSPADSGSVSLGSSPGTPANKCTRAPSSSGLGLWLLKSATRVRIPSGLHIPQLLDRKGLGQNFLARNLNDNFSSTCFNLITSNLGFGSINCYSNALTCSI